MKPIRYIVRYSLAAWVLWAITSSFWSQHSAVDSEAIFQATVRYVNNRLKHDQSSPQDVSLNELVSTRYLSSSKVPFGVGRCKVKISETTDESNKTWIALALPGAQAHYLVGQ